jgi:hypothetical protein
MSTVVDAARNHVQEEPLVGGRQMKYFKLEWTLLYRREGTA